MVSAKRRVWGSFYDAKVRTLIGVLPKSANVVDRKCLERSVSGYRYCIENKGFTTGVAERGSEDLFRLLEILR